MYGLNNDEIIKLRNEILDKCQESLNQAESEWIITGAEQHLTEKAVTKFENYQIYDSVASNIPGHESVGVPQISNFIALVCDIRKSSQRLSTNISSAKVNGIQRIFYETSALLPSLELVVERYKGSVTEYLGDGILGLFHYKSKDDLYDAYHASLVCMELVREIVNKEIYIRYKLPSLDIGIGLALSPCIVRVVANKHPKAFGKCVWEASKLSGETNKIIVNDKLNAVWPVSKTGCGLNFTTKIVKGVEGFKLYPQK